MPIPLLESLPKTQNHRVISYAIPGDEEAKIYSTQDLRSSVEMDELIWAAYRQVFNEQQILSYNRQTVLESQLRASQISAKAFIRGLVLSDIFRRNNYEPNNNYRFVQMCFQRLLGRDVYDEQEKLAWSIILATKGLTGFIDALLDSEEYLTVFGDDIIPYQRSRILPQRAEGDLPFARLPRYDASYREQLRALGYFSEIPVGYRWEWQKPPYPPLVRIFGKIVTIGGAALLTLLVVAIALSAWGIITL